MERSLLPLQNTENRSNFVKTFKTFAVDPTPLLTSEEEIEQEGDNDQVEEAIFENMCDVLALDPVKDDDYTQVEYELPPHERCASHTLNLVASSDIDKSLSSSPLSKNIYRSSFAKCTTLWNKVSRSTVASDHVEENLKLKVTVASPTRWNSYYDAVSRIRENTLDEINTLCTKLF